MNEILKNMAAGYARKGLTVLAMYLMTKGLLPSNEQNEFIGAGMMLASVGWEAYAQYGHAAVASLLKKLTAAPTVAAAAAVAKAAPAVKVVPLIAIMILGSMFLPSAAHAELKKLQVTGHLASDIAADVKNAKSAPGAVLGDSDAALTSALAKPFQDLAAFLGSDATGAAALSTQITALQDGHGQQCWLAMATAGAVFKAHPVPVTFKVMTDVEALRLLAMTANNLCVNVHCTQVFADLSSMAQAASPTPLSLPSLHDLCIKIPQIAQVAAITPPAAAAVATPAPAAQP